MVNLFVTHKVCKLAESFVAMLAEMSDLLVNSLDVPLQGRVDGEHFCTQMTLISLAQMKSFVSTSASVRHQDSTTDATRKRRLLVANVFWCHAVIKPIKSHRDLAECGCTSTLI